MQNMSVIITATMSYVSKKREKLQSQEERETHTHTRDVNLRHGTSGNAGFPSLYTPSFNLAFLDKTKVFRQFLFLR